MQVKSSITHTVYFEVQDGTSIEDIRAHALAKIDDSYSEEEDFGITVENKVTEVLQSSMPGHIPLRESVEIQVSKVE